MSTTVSLPRRSSTSRRPQILASASGLVAAVSIAVTLAVVGGGDGQSAGAQPAGSPATAQPNPATLYRNEAALPRPEKPAGASAAERFHHFHHFH
jgi:amino acid transporter